MNKNKETIKAITEGAIYVAIYALIAIASRFLITATDSLLYYLLPLPLAIYSARQKVTYSLVCFLASIALAFLFTNYIYVLTLFIPNLFIGFLFGILNVKSHNKLINYIFVFILMLGADFLSIYAYELVTGIGYFDDMVGFATNIFNKLLVDIDENTILRIIKVVSIAVLLIDSVVKELLNYVLFSLIVIRLKLVKDYKLTFQIPLIYHFGIALSYIGLSLLLILLTSASILSGSSIATIFLILTLTIHFLLGIYLIYLFAIYIKFKIKKENKLLLFFIILLCFILFPISIIYSLILNLINYDIVKHKFGQIK